MTPEEIEAIQKENADLRDKNTKLNDESAHHRKGKADYKAQAAKFDGIDLDAYKKTMADNATMEADKLKASGKYEEALAESTKTLTAENESLKAIISGHENFKSKTLIEGGLRAGMNGRAINEDQVIALTQGNIKIEGDSVVIMDGESPRLNAKGQRMSTVEYMDDFFASNPQHEKPGPGGSGSNGNSGNIAPPKGPVAGVDRIRKGLESKKG